MRNRVLVSILQCSLHLHGCSIDFAYVRISSIRPCLHSTPNVWFGHLTTKERRRFVPLTEAGRPTQSGLHGLRRLRAEPHSVCPSWRSSTGLQSSKPLPVILWLQHWTILSATGQACCCSESNDEIYQITPCPKGTKMLELSKPFLSLIRTTQGLLRLIEFTSRESNCQCERYGLELTICNVLRAVLVHGVDAVLRDCVPQLLPRVESQIGKSPDLCEHTDVTKCTMRILG